MAYHLVAMTLVDKEPVVHFECLRTEVMQVAGLEAVVDGKETIEIIRSSFKVAQLQELR